LTWRTGVKELNVQVLNFHAWTFFFGIAFFTGLFALHRLSLVREAAGSSDPLLLRDLLLEARRSLRGISSIAGLLRPGAGATLDRATAQAAGSGGTAASVLTIVVRPKETSCRNPCVHR
jgi:hypothetical protein